VRKKIPVIGRAIKERGGKTRRLDDVYRGCVFIHRDRILLSMIDDAVVHSPGSPGVHTAVITPRNLVQVVYICTGLGDSLDPNRSTAGSFIRRASWFSVVRKGSSLLIHCSARKMPSLLKVWSVMVIGNVKRIGRIKIL
jgi:hypothetical protein